MFISYLKLFPYPQCKKSFAMEVRLNNKCKAISIDYERLFYFLIISELLKYHQWILYYETGHWENSVELYFSFIRKIWQTELPQWRVWYSHLHNCLSKALIRARVAHGDGFLGMKRIRVDGMLVHRNVTPSTFAGTDLYTRCTKCLA